MNFKKTLPSFPSTLLLLVHFAASCFLFPYHRPLMLPLTCTASMVSPPPETQVQLSMVTRSVWRQKPDSPFYKHWRGRNSFLCWPLTSLWRGTCWKRTSPLALILLFSRRVRTCCYGEPHSYLWLPAVLQFYRSLSQFTQQLYRRVGFIQLYPSITSTKC